mmetsp:Transcript_97910/g.178921  ORF Transcript_97910/g.178921 Transcript_97910/m.178921 type:complete len:263 (+) Transcript_97910:45-833(+)
MASMLLTMLDDLQTPGADWTSESPAGKRRPPALAAFSQETVLELDGVNADFNAGVQIFSMDTPPSKAADSVKMHYIGSPTGADQAFGTLFSGECEASPLCEVDKQEAGCAVEEFSPVASPKCSSSQASTPRTCSPDAVRKPRKLSSDRRGRPGRACPGDSSRSRCSSSSSCCSSGSPPRLRRAPSPGRQPCCAAKAQITGNPQLPLRGGALREIVAANEALLHGILQEGPPPTEEDSDFDSDFELELPDFSSDGTMTLVPFP